MSESEYRKLQSAGAIGKAAVKGAPKRFSPEVAKARSIEQTKRFVEAKRRANAVLAYRHSDEYAILLNDEKTAVADERGPLPGD